jgi:hypothetical protein
VLFEGGVFVPLTDTGSAMFLPDDEQPPTLLGFTDAARLRDILEKTDVAVLGVRSGNGQAIFPEQVLRDWTTYGPGAELRLSLALAAPAACLDQEDGAMSYRVKAGGHRELFPSLELGDVLDLLEIGDQYLDGVRREVESILAAPAGITLFEWTSAFKEEKDYNLEARKHGYVCLDRKLIRTAQHPYGFEAADLVSADGTLVHVKRADSSAPLSHLFAQGRVSADALRFDSEARAEFVRRVREQNPSHAIGDDFFPTKVVYAISLKSGKSLTTQNLFTFAQMSLLQAARALRAQGIKVAVVDIPTVVDPPVC